jgi:tetratricopeptide (TPR) repeat protein
VSKKLPQRLLQLEKEVRTLRSALEKEEALPPRSLLGRFLKSLSEHSVLWTFAGCVMMAAFVQWRFGVDYFEEQRSIQVKKKLAAFHRDLGDELLTRVQDWEAAEASYLRATEIDPGDSGALFGVAKAQVFRPIEGQKMVYAELVHARMALLARHFPEDPQVDYLRGYWELDTGNLEEARQWFTRSTRKDPGFAAGHLGCPC